MVVERPEGAEHPEGAAGPVWREILSGGGPLHRHGMQPVQNPAQRQPWKGASRLGIRHRGKCPARTSQVRHRHLNCPAAVLSMMMRHF